METAQATAFAELDLNHGFPACQYWDLRYISYTLGQCVLQPQNGDHRAADRVLLSNVQGPKFQPQKKMGIVILILQDLMGVF